MPFPQPADLIEGVQSAIWRGSIASKWTWRRLTPAMSQGLEGVNGDADIVIALHEGLVYQNDYPRRGSGSSGRKVAPPEPEPSVEA